MKLVEGWSSLSVSHLTAAVLVNEIAATVSGCWFFRRVDWDVPLPQSASGIPHSSFSIATGEQETHPGVFSVPAVFPGQCSGVQRKRLSWPDALIWEFKVISVVRWDWCIYLLSLGLLFVLFSCSFFQGLQWRFISSPFTGGKPGLQK